MITHHRCVQAVAVAAVVLSSARSTAAEPVDFVRDVRPILSAKCYFCHGPDEATREAGLRLDQPQAATADLGGYAAIVASDPESSEAILRIRESDSSTRMPPPDSGKTLSPAEIDTLTAWIAQGAEYQPHWAFEPITRKAPPRDLLGGSDHPIDRFVRARLAQSNLQSAPPADPYTLVRRVYLDLIGLPPTVEEADAFAANPTDDAFEQLVDRLLESPHYGERWARKWLDLARYSDTKGFEKDRPRSIWPYRDWVINAINADMPFDQFTVEQIAGDMLPDPTLDQLIATGFHRNTMTNEEGGIDPQEYRFLSVVDRVNTTGTTWLGMTIGCAQCHTHKYDPITHSDYYAMFALLNNAEEPKLALPSTSSKTAEAERLRKIASLEQSLADRYKALAAEDPEVQPLEQAFAGWLTELAQMAVRWTSVAPKRLKTNLPTTETLADDSVLVSGDVTNADRYDVWLDPNERTVTAVRLEALPDASLPGEGSGRRTILENNGSGEGSFLLTEMEVAVVQGDDARPIKLSAASATFTPPDLSPELVIDGRPDTGWTVHGRQRERQTLVVRPAETIVLADGEQLRIQLRHDSFYPAGLGRFRLSVTSDDRPAVANGLPDELLSAVSDDPVDSSQRRRLRQVFLESTPVLNDEQTELHRLRNERVEQTTTLVMRERGDTPRVTHRHHRGEYLKPREAIAPATPARLPSLPENASADRLALARWLVSEENPLTARVVVNRHWHALFGRGLVKTLDDFGLQGEYPSHPELLDWLATTFVEHGWSRKQLHKLIVTSETYRQASTNPEAQASDPENVLLARASRVRLDGELVRDVLLHASGLLAEKIGGPSVFPPQPAGITEAAYGPLVWTVNRGEDRYRRGLYTFNKRTAPYVAFGLFDSPSGEFCVPRRDRSSTPLQALATLNDTVVVEAARALAIRLTDEHATEPNRAAALLRRCLTRPPAEEEVVAVTDFVKEQKARLIAGELDPYRLLNAGSTRRWDFDATTDGWTARKDASAKANDGVLVVPSEGADPFIGVEVEAPVGKYTIKLNAKLTTEGPIEVYWTTLDDPTESPQRRVVAGQERGEWQTHQLEFETNGPLRTLRIDPGTGAGTAWFKSIELTFGDGLVTLSDEDDPIELAAWLLASRALLNLDEVITRP